MRTSESIKTIAPAFLAAQKEIKSVTKDADNPFFKSKYADLPSVINACKDELNKHGIAVLQPVMGDMVETVLLHESGEWMAGRTMIVNAKPNDPQAQGSAITYARRYGLMSMVFIPAEDDDAESAMDRAKAKAPSQSERAKVIGGMAEKLENGANEEKWECDFCKAPAMFREGTNRAGKPYKGVFCTKDQTHVTWM